MKTALLVVAVIFFAGCGDISPSELDSLLAREPRVVSISPHAGSVIDPASKVIVEFSQPIFPSSVGSGTLAVIKAETDAGKTSGDVAQSVVAGKSQGIPGSYEFGGDSRLVTFQPEKPYDKGAYLIVATDKILSVDMLPLAHTSGGNIRAFVSQFVVDDSAEGAASVAEEGAAPGENGEAQSGGADPAVSQESGVSEGSAPEGGDSEDGGPTSKIELVRPETLVINELLYDVTGDDTNGQVFVELYGDSDTTIGGYKLIFIDGKDGSVSDTIEIPAGAKLSESGVYLIADAKTGQSGVSAVVGADFILNFDPQNGPDSVQLVDETGALIDVLGYGTSLPALAANSLACFEEKPAAKVPANSSLTRTDGADSGHNAADFKAGPTPTPGVL